MRLTAQTLAAGEMQVAHQRGRAAATVSMDMVHGHIHIDKVTTALGSR